MPRILSRAGLHTAAFYFAFFASTGVHLPFWPLWLGDWGLTPAEVGLFTSIGVATRLVAGLAIPALADRLDRWRATVATCAVAGALLFLAHRFVETRASLLLLTVGTGIAYAAISPIAEALGVAAARLGAFPYAQARGLGSLGFLAANLAAGALIAHLGSGVALWWIVACLLAVALLGLRHPGGGGVRERAPPRFGEISHVISLPVFAIFVLAAACLQASHATYYALGSLHWRALGLGEGRIGALWGFSVGVEVLLMVAGGAFLMNRVGAVGSLLLSGAGGLVRWGWMTTDPTGWTLWPLQSLHALTFAAGHLGAMAFITRAVPARYGAAAQGASGAMASGLALSLGMALSAWAYPSLGGRTYGIGFAFSLAGLGFTLWLGRRWSGEELAV